MESYRLVTVELIVEDADPSADTRQRPTSNFMFLIEKSRRRYVNLPPVATGKRLTLFAHLH